MSEDRLAAARGLVLAMEEPSVADLLRRYLPQEGFGVQVESSGAAALAVVRRRLRPVAIILDVGLPDSPPTPSWSG